MNLSTAWIFYTYQFLLISIKLRQTLETILSYVPTNVPT